MSYEESFASFLYGKFMKQNCWYRVKEHIHIIGPFIEGHELCVLAFQKPEVEKTSLKGDDISFPIYFVDIFI